MTSEAGPGSIAGASGDAGVEYRRGVAAYAVACGLAGQPFLGVGVPEADASVESVVLETEDPLDDIRVNFHSGWTVLIQAKRKLNKGKNFVKAVDQWVDAARSQLDPKTHRFVIVGGLLSGSIRVLQRVLERYKLDLPGPPTKEEAEELAYLENLLKDLTPEQQQTILRCGVICEMAVENAADTGAKQAIQYLSQVASGGDPQNGIKAWNELRAATGKAARLRGGYSLDGWLEQLRGAGVPIDPVGKTPAAELERLHGALERYKARLVRTGSAVDLRGLGAQIAPIPLEEADAEVRVGTDPEDERAEGDLLWAFLRRGRVVLTGLPGGGKTTAIRCLAAKLCTLPGAPLPLRVSLREVDALAHVESFRDRLLSAAVRDDAPEDRALIRAELERRLSTGGVALLLDSLDETYDKRAAVASEIDNFMSSISEDVDALLSTRDVAYGHAATLGWFDLALRPPQEAKRAVGAILRRSAESKVSESQRKRWVEDRVRWVMEALSRDGTLSETPLFPVLLALLAAEKELDTLPTGRARVLSSIVRDAVAKHEVSRQPANPLGPLVSSAIDTAAMHAYSVEASAILDASGSINLDQLTALVAEEVAAYWDMSAGQAATTARDAIRFFDGIGIFVVTGSTETVAPRVALFAEIGDALRATVRPDDVTNWVKARLQSRQFEPVILAAGLDPSAAKVLGSIAGESHDRETLFAAVQAFKEGAPISDSDLRSICARLIDDMRTAAPAAWTSWGKLLQLPITADMRTAIEAAAKAFDQQRQKLVAAELDLKFCSTEELLLDPETLLDVLKLEHLPHIPVAQKKHGIFNIAEYVQNDQLGKVQLAAAELLIGHVPDVIGLVLERAKHGPEGLKKGFKELLIRTGHEAEAAEIAEPAFDGRLVSWLRDYDKESESKFLRLLADRQQVELSYQQQTRCDDLADLMATLSLNDVSSLHMFKHSEDIPLVVNLAEALFGFEPGVVASEAKLTLQRMEVAASVDPYYALFDNAATRYKHDWSNISDVDSAVALLGRMLTWGKAHAWFVAAALWDAPVFGPAVSMLRQRLPELRSSAEHLRIAALTLCSLVDGPEPMSWLDDSSPVLRGVVAELCDCSEAGYLTDKHKALLNDPDRGVRLSALNRAYKLHPPDIETLLRDIAEQPPVGWMCWSCQTSNDAGAGSCSRPRCFRAAPNLQKRTQELLERLS